MGHFHRKCRRTEKCAPLPRLWLFTDERITDEALIAALSRLPRGSGVVFRHYESGREKRQALFGKIRAMTRRRGCTLLVAGTGSDCGSSRADGIHLPRWARKNRKGRRGMLLSMSVHDRRDLIMAHREGADLIFLSPVFPSRSHPGGRTLGPARFSLMARAATMPVIALGGMNPSRFRRLRALGAHGWGAIDALSLKNERKAEK